MKCICLKVFCCPPHPIFKRPSADHFHYKSLSMRLGPVCGRRALRGPRLPQEPTPFRARRRLRRRGQARLRPQGHRRRCGPGRPSAAVHPRTPRQHNPRVPECIHTFTYTLNEELPPRTMSPSYTHTTGTPRTIQLKASSRPETMIASPTELLCLPPPRIGTGTTLEVEGAGVRALSLEGAVGISSNPNSPMVCATVTVRRTVMITPTVRIESIPLPHGSLGLQTLLNIPRIPSYPAPRHEDHTSFSE